MIDGVIVKELTPHGDVRGVFVETFRLEWFPDGFTPKQANRADRVAGSVTGLHYHLHQSDWWYVSHGTARLVLVDLRHGARTEREVMAIDVKPDDGDHRGVYVPPGVAHGFASLTDMTLNYLVDQYYDVADENGVAWDDPDLAIDWGVSDPIVTSRDASNPRFADLPRISPG